MLDASENQDLEQNCTDDWAASAEVRRTGDDRRGRHERRRSSRGLLEVRARREGVADDRRREERRARRRRLFNQWRARLLGTFSRSQLW